MTQDEIKQLSPLERMAYWIEEREAIRLKREAGESKPWTQDPILLGYRFCNVRRMDDRVSRWLLENWYQPYLDHPSMLVNVALARFINNPPILQEIGFQEECGYCQRVGRSGMLLTWSEDIPRLNTRGTR
jgi:hypothetical protein